MDEVKRRLGYRLVLQQGQYTDEVRPCDGLNVQLSLKNEGFAAPFNPRGVEVILRRPPVRLPLDRLGARSRRSPTPPIPPPIPRSSGQALGGASHLWGRDQNWWLVTADSVFAKYPVQRLT